MDARLLILPGDGIGPEVVDQAVKALAALAARGGHRFELSSAPIGGAAIDETGLPLPERTVELARQSDAVLLGAVGGPKWEGGRVRPEQGLLGIRKQLGLYANLRPVTVLPELATASTLRPEVIAGVDLLVVRELTGGIYFGEPSGISGEPGRRASVDTCAYSEAEIERLLVAAFELARGRRRRLCLVDKANVMATSRLWRDVGRRLAAAAPDIEYSEMLVDACAMQLVRRPAQFDVIATENLFGDILSDEAAMLSGSIGLLPSASVGAPRDDGRRFGLYEPVHGSAPDIAGRDLANPLATLLSLAMLLRGSLGLDEDAALLERSVRGVLADGFRTGDIMSAGARQVGCAAMGDLVAERLRQEGRA